MERVHNSGICSDCNELPKESPTGALTCACGKRWYRRLGKTGTREETETLKRHGFEITEDCQGDIYYCGPLNLIIWLYADGTWATSAKGAPISSLQEHLAHIKHVSGEIARV
jgi:hypothetical protein